MRLVFFGIVPKKLWRSQIIKVLKSVSGKDGLIDHFVTQMGYKNVSRSLPISLSLLITDLLYIM